MCEDKITAKPDLIIAISVRGHIHLKHNAVNCWTNNTSPAMCSLDNDIATKLREGEANGPNHWQQDVQGLNKFTAKPDIIISFYLCEDRPI